MSQNIRRLIILLLIIAIFALLLLAYILPKIQNPGARSENITEGSSSESSIWSYVETGLENEEFVEILNSNLPFKEGDLVITSGHYTLAHDAEVKLVSGVGNVTSFWI